MTTMILPLGLYVVIALWVAAPFLTVGIVRVRQGRKTLGYTLAGWGAAIVLLPVIASQVAYLFGRPDAGFSATGEVYPLWPLVLALGAAVMLGGSFVWFLGWLAGRGIAPEPSPSPRA